MARSLSGVSEAAEHALEPSALNVTRAPRLSADVMRTNGRPFGTRRNHGACRPAAPAALPPRAIVAAVAPARHAGRLRRAPPYVVRQRGSFPDLGERNTGQNESAERLRFTSGAARPLRPCHTAHRHGRARIAPDGRSVLDDESRPAANRDRDHAVWRGLNVNTIRAAPSGATGC